MDAPVPQRCDGQSKRKHNGQNMDKIYLKSSASGRGNAGYNTKDGNGVSRTDCQFSIADNLDQLQQTHDYIMRNG